MLAIIQAISLFGLKVEADGRCEREVLSACSAMIVVQNTFFVTVPVIVTNLKGSFAVRAIKVVAHV